jgi:hypothetical protein
LLPALCLPVVERAAFVVAPCAKLAAARTLIGPE